MAIRQLVFYRFPIDSLKNTAINPSLANLLKKHIFDRHNRYEIMNISHDLHLHTHLSACCGDKENMVVAKLLPQAVALGLKLVGFSDHVWMNQAIAPSPWYRPQDASQIQKLRDELAEMGSLPLRVSVGCEADMRAPAEFSITHDFAESMDHVLLSCSHFHMKNFVEQPADSSPRAVAEHLMRFFISGVKSGLATSIAHPFLPIGDVERLDAIIGSLSENELMDVLSLAAEHRVALEITRSFLPKENNERTFSLETPLRILTLAKKAGCRFTFGSDAHSMQMFVMLPRLEKIVDMAGVTEADLAVC